MHVCVHMRYKPQYLTRAQIHLYALNWLEQSGRSPPLTVNSNGSHLRRALQGVLYKVLPASSVLPGTPLISRVLLLRALHGYSQRTLPKRHVCHLYVYAPARRRARPCARAARRAATATARPSLAQSANSRKSRRVLTGTRRVLEGCCRVLAPT